jgi:two-component system alkaline phosphatase synthesis response regulator PhoP
MKSSSEEIPPRGKTKVLCVEDDINLQRSLSFILWKEGYQVVCATTGEEALEMAKAEKPDLVLLDLILPGIDGDKVCSILKKDPATADVLVIVISAKKKVEDIVARLKGYADDYITKPFEPEILLARIQALLRRKTRAEEKIRAILEIDDLVINRDAYEVRVGGRKVRLSKTEFDILAMLASRPNQVFTRSRILDQVREDGYPITERVVDYHVTGLRKKLGQARKYIHTVRGVGYKFNAEDNS